MGAWEKQDSSRLGRSVVTALATASVNTTLFTTYFSTGTHQVRVSHTFSGGIWGTIGSTAVVTANSAAAFIPNTVPEYFTVTEGQVLNFISTSTSTGYVVITEMA